MGTHIKEVKQYSNDISSPGYIESTASSTRKSKEKLRVDQLIPSEILENSAGMKQLLEAYYTFMNLDEFIYAANEDFQDVILDGKAVFRISDPKNENNQFFTDEQGADSTMTVTPAIGANFILPLNDINVNISNGNELPGSLALETSEIGKTFQVLIPDVTKKSAGVSPIVDVNGVVTGFIGNLGYRYPTAPTITIAAPESGTQATASVQLSTTVNPNPYLDTSGSLQLTITNGGSGYTAENPPTVTIAANPNADEVVFTPNGSTAKLNTPIKNWVGPGPSHVLNNIDRAMDIDNNSLQFLELMQKEIASVIPRDITVNKRNLYKNIVDYYKVRGSADSIEIFFRLLFNDEVEVQYPWDKTLIPSSGNWDINPALPKGGQYLDNKGQLSNVIKIQDSLRYQKFSYLIRTGQNVSTWENVFNRLVHPAGFKFFGEILMIIELSKAILGEDVADGDTLYRKVLSAMPERQPGAIGIEDLPILVDMFASVFLPSIKAKIHSTGTINIPPGSIKNGVISTVAVNSGGSGYLVAPVLNSSDTGVPAGFTTGTFDSVVVNGSVTGVNVIYGGYDYNIPSMTAAAPPPIVFDGSDDEIAGTGIVDITNNTIKLTAVQAAALPIGSQVTYNSGGGTSIGGLISGDTYFIMTNTNNRVSLQTVLNGSQVQITSQGTGTTHNFTGTTATLTPTKIDGTITKVEINKTGYGYTSPPSFTINGVPIATQSLVQPNIVIGLDSSGRLDIDNITINNGGSGYQQAFGSVAANPNSGQLAAIEIVGGADKNFNSVPSIVISQPTATDSAGVLLPSNALASAIFTLDSNNEINGYTITNPGSGYTGDPIVRINSNANNEIRGKDLRPILILLINHIEHGERTDISNNSFNRKGNTFNNSAKRWNFNATFDQLGSRQIQSTTTTNINKYNVNSFIHTN